jgi:hypothetical protein
MCLYFYISTFRSTHAVPRMIVFCSLLFLPGWLLRYCLNDFEMVLVAPVVTNITFAFIFHMCWISVVRSLYFSCCSHHCSCCCCIHCQVQYLGLRRYALALIIFCTLPIPRTFLFVFWMTEGLLYLKINHVCYKEMEVFRRKELHLILHTFHTDNKHTYLFSLSDLEFKILM